MLRSPGRPTALAQVGGYVASNYMAFGGALLLNVAFARGLTPSGRGHLALGLHLSYIVATFTAGGLERTVGPLTDSSSFSESLALTAQLSRQRTRVAIVVLMATTAIGSLLYSDTVALALGAATLIGLGTGAMLCIKAAALSSGSTFLFGGFNSAIQLTILATIVIAETITELDWVHYLLAFLPPYVLVTGFVYLRRIRSTEVLSIPPSVLRASYRFGLGTLASKTAMRADRLLIPVFASSAELGRYVVPAAIAEVAVFATGSISEALIPFLSRRAKRGERTGLRQELAVTGAVATMIGIGTAICLMVLIGPVFGASYHPTLTLALLLGTGAGFLAASQLAGNSLAARDRSTIVGQAEVTGAAVAIVAYLLLIPRGGAEGAALAATLTYALMAAYQLWGLARSESDSALIAPSV